MTTGERIKKVRLEKHLTQKELGKKIGGVSQQQIGQWETGKANPKIETIRKIAAALGVFMSDLVDDWSTFSREEMAGDWKDRMPGGITHKEAIALGGYPVAESEKSLLDNYRQLNPTGQGKAIEQVELLTKIPEYRKDQPDPTKRQ